MSRKILLGSVLIILIIVVAGVGYGIWKLQSGNANANNTTKDFFSAFFPFGQSPQTIKTATGTANTDAPAKVLTRLRQISNRPTAGAWFFAPASSSTPTRIRFLERATGHIFETPVDSYAETRLSNTTIPLVQEAVPLSENNMILRTISNGENISNAFGSLNATTSEQTMHTVPLANFNRVAVGQGGSTILTVTETTEGSRIELQQSDGSSSRTLLTSPIRSWIPLASGEQFFIESAPSSGIPGFLYEIKVTGSISSVVGEIAGLIALPSPTGRYILYSSESGAQVALGMLDRKTGIIYTSPLDTLATKCAWVSEEPPKIFCGVPDPVDAGSVTLPDDWFLGRIALNDGAWIINPIESSAHFLGKLQTIANTPIDVSTPVISPDGTYALFTNKNDLTLWALDLTRDR